MAGNTEKRPLSWVEERQFEENRLLQAALRHIDPDGSSEHRMAWAVILRIAKEYYEGLVVPGWRRRTRARSDADSLFSALEIPVGSRADKLLKAMKEELLK